jgi:hypothetical protein
MIYKVFNVFDKEGNELLNLEKINEESFLLRKSNPVRNHWYLIVE